MRTFLTILVLYAATIIFGTGCGLIIEITSGSVKAGQLTSFFVTLYIAFKINSLIGERSK